MQAVFVCFRSINLGDGEIREIEWIGAKQQIL